MKPVTQLVRIKHGSHLYGTSTPTSDQDFKGVHLPSGEAIILQRAENVINSGVVAKEGTKNTSEAIDSDSYSVQKFFDMLMKGDTVATEILFAAVPADGQEFHPLWPQVRLVGLQLLNRQCKGFVGYCVRQAAKYGIKGSRMAAVKLVRDYLVDKSWGLKLAEYESFMREAFQGQEHISWENIPHPNGADCWHLVCCDRKVPMTTRIAEAFKIYDTVWKNYGERARAAMTNEGVDWKAVSHAVRVAHQAIELLETGTITFPRPSAAYLLEIKQGKLPYSQVGQELELLVEQVQAASERSILPERSDAALADAFVLQMYREQIR